MRYSLGSLLANAVTGNRNWKPVWREPEPKASKPSRPVVRKSTKKESSDDE